jgi:exodeoxyribonuclease VII large subunit
MPTYLTAGFREKDKVKALGAQFDGALKQWFVPDGRDLTPFRPWLPQGAEHLALTTAVTSTSTVTRGNEVATAGQGIALTQLLSGVADLVAQSYREGVWTRVEVVKVSGSRGHVYLELAERDSEGNAIAQARGMIWAGMANRIVPEFERATGAVLGPGIKLLIRAKPQMSERFGFGLEIDAIDPNFTLGDLEAKKREIRSRLQKEGLFDRNRALPLPWDYRVVLVIAPENAAGLGDFRAEAERLFQHQICKFIYAHSVFQGERAPAQISAAIHESLSGIASRGEETPDAVVIIRGGGAVNDLAWLNNYDLARTVCELNVPVLTGIGHERDQCILDEVARVAYDTPSKVINGIENTIRLRVAETRQNMDAICKAATAAIVHSRRVIDREESQVKAAAKHALAIARESVQEIRTTMERLARQSLTSATASVTAALVDVRHDASGQLANAKRSVPELFTAIRFGTQQSLREARTQSATFVEVVTDRARGYSRDARQRTLRHLEEVRLQSRRALAQARQGSEALILEVTGQGPHKTLGRGFAIVRDTAGKPITSAISVNVGDTLDIEFRDGNLGVQASRSNN